MRGSPVEALRTADPDRIGDYAVLARLGGGAMGTVYLGRPPGGRTVAVKVARAWLATEYVPGPTLRDAVATHLPLPEPALRRPVAGLAEALLAIHTTGMVHRDLKPSTCSWPRTDPGLFPVCHERRRRTRDREVRELRAALGWYGATAHDSGN